MFGKLNGQPVSITGSAFLRGVSTDIVMGFKKSSYFAESKLPMSIVNHIWQFTCSVVKRSMANWTTVTYKKIFTGCIDWSLNSNSLWYKFGLWTWVLRKARKVKLNLRILKITKALFCLVPRTVWIKVYRSFNVELVLTRNNTWTSFRKSKGLKIWSWNEKFSIVVKDSMVVLKIQITVA